MGNYLEASMSANLDKITRCVIQPIQSLWGYEVDEYTARAYVDELRYFTEDALNLAIKNLRRTSEKRPTMAKLLKACYDSRAESANTLEVAKKPERLTKAQVDDVMQGSLGAIAYREGYWWQLFEFLSMRATDTFVTDKQLEIIKAEAARADDQELARKVLATPDMYRKPLLSFYDTLMKRKEHARLRYGFTA